MVMVDDSGDEVVRDDRVLEVDVVVDGESPAADDDELSLR